MKVTIVGGGFGGVKTALVLAKQRNMQVTLISDRPDFQYYPALYGAATGHSKRQAWIPLGEIFGDVRNVQVYIDTITSIDKDAKELTASSGKVYEYDHCVLALGSVTTYFGIKGLDEFAHGIKSAEEITRLKEHLYTQMGEQRTIDKNYVIIGGGPTGVELAATLGSYLERLRVYYKLPQSKIRVTLVEASPRLLPRMSETTSRRVKKRLEKLGVKIETNKVVQSENADTLMVSDRPIKSQTVIWTSGVANNPFYKANEQQFEFSKNGKIVVDEYMRAGKNLYVIGDNAFTPYSGLAQIALHDAQFVADNLIRHQEQRTLRAYHAVMPPVVVPVGENWAAFEWRKLRLYGYLASLLRRAADVIGYSDILPLGHALNVFQSQEVVANDYFTPPTVRKVRKK
ncbi:MAG: NAD(P)/FAD-dependent oxidoreductase [Candidatus Saccharimonadales bacterium]